MSQLKDLGLSPVSMSFLLRIPCDPYRDVGGSDSTTSSDFCPRPTPKAETRLLTIIPIILPQCQHMALSLLGNEYFFPLRELILIPLGGCSISPFIPLCPQLAQVVAVCI